MQQADRKDGVGVCTGLQGFLQAAKEGTGLFTLTQDGLQVQPAPLDALQQPQALNQRRQTTLP
jgi:hypothetical protein